IAKPPDGAGRAVPGFREGFLARLRGRPDPRHPRGHRLRPGRLDRHRPGAHHPVRPAASGRGLRPDVVLLRRQHARARGAGAVGAPMTTLDVETPTVEREVVVYMVRRAAPALPVLVLVAGLVRGMDWAWSAGFAIALVVFNFLLAAALIGWAARISPVA